MGISILFLLTGVFAFSQQKTSPAVVSIEILYPKHKEIFLQCLNKYTSREKSIGCVDSYKYLRGLCEVVQEGKFERRYPADQVHRIYQACKFVAKGDNRLPAFFELDAKACVQGFETLNDRLMSFNKNKKLIEEVGEEKFLYMHEKNLCKDYESYVNFCKYVDGPNRNFLPSIGLPLPKPEGICSQSRPLANGLYTINRDLVALAADPNLDAHNTLILKYRSRLPASSASFAACEQVRIGYKNFGCYKFENFLEGEPNWRTPEKMQQNRDEKTVDSEN